MHDLKFHYKPFPQRSFLFFRKLKSPRKNSRYADLLIQIIPTERKTAHFDFNFLQLIVSVAQSTTCRR